MSACEANAVGVNTMDPRYKETRELVHMSACEANAVGENTMDA